MLPPDGQTYIEIADQIPQTCNRAQFSLQSTTENQNVLSHRTKDRMEVQKAQITQELNTMAEVEKLQEMMSMYKAHLPLRKLCFLGVLAGWWC
jgi:hypothetical protein